MVVLVVAMVLAVGVWLMTRAAALGHMKPNGALGIRTPATQRSDEAWVAGHRAALPLLGWSALVVVIVGVSALVGVFGSGTREAAGLVLLGAETGAVVVAAVLAHRAASRVPVP